MKGCPQIFIYIAQISLIRPSLEYSCSVCNQNIEKIKQRTSRFASNKSTVVQDQTRNSNSNPCNKIMRLLCILSCQPLIYIHKAVNVEGFKLWLDQYNHLNSVVGMLPFLIIYSHWRTPPHYSQVSISLAQHFVTFRCIHFFLWNLNHGRPWLYPSIHIHQQVWSQKQNHGFHYYIH